MNYSDYCAAAEIADAELDLSERMERRGDEGRLQALLREIDADPVGYYTREAERHERLACGYARQPRLAWKAKAHVNAAAQCRAKAEVDDG